MGGHLVVLLDGQGLGFLSRKLLAFAVLEAGEVSHKVFDVLSPEAQATLGLFGQLFGEEGALAMSTGLV